MNRWIAYREIGYPICMHPSCDSTRIFRNCRNMQYKCNVINKVFRNCFQIKYKFLYIKKVHVKLLMDITWLFLYISFFMFHFLFCNVFFVSCYVKHFFYCLGGLNLIFLRSSHRSVL